MMDFRVDVCKLIFSLIPKLKQKSSKNVEGNGNFLPSATMLTFHLNLWTYFFFLSCPIKRKFIKNFGLNSDDKFGGFG